MKLFRCALFILSSLNFIDTKAQFGPIYAGPINFTSAGIVNGVWINEHIPTKRMIPYEHVREADAIWSSRVFQYIDLREKINHPLYYPLDEITAAGVWITNATRWSLWTVLRAHILIGDLRVFSPYNPNNKFGEWDGYQLKYPVDPEPGKNFHTDSAYHDELVYYLGYLGPQSDIFEVNEYGDPIEIELANGTTSYKYPARDTMWYTSKDIIQYHIKEDWFFDKERSVLDVRIIALAPVVYDITEDANGNRSINGTRELFWLYFPHCRFILNNYFVYNDKNDSQWISFDDLFWKRRFSSVIYKESNVYDRNVESYKFGIDALYEAEKIKNEIRNIEHDVWSF